MPFDHYIPASYLGRFSSEEEGPRRRRRLWVVDQRKKTVTWEAAEKVCGARGFYSLSKTNADPRLVDDMWSSYEPGLSAALDSMIAGEIDAGEWLRTLVRFVAALLIRGSDFGARFNERFAPLGKGLEDRLTADNTHMARLFEWQRLFASVIGARWRLLETPGHLAQITNDLGYTPFLNPQLGESGLAIPVGKRHILLVVACRKRVIARAQNGVWRPTIDRGTLDDAAHAAFLDSIAVWARRYVLGPDEAQMRAHLRARAAAPPVPEPASLGFMSGAMARRYEMLYFHCAIQFDAPPSTPDAQVYVDFEKNMPAAGEDATHDAQAALEGGSDPLPAA